MHMIWGDRNWPNGRAIVSTACSTVVVSLFVSVAGAVAFDGSKPLVCAAESGQDCLRVDRQCNPLKSETNIEPVFEIDFARKTVHSPYRKSLLQVAHMTANKESLVLQGSDLLFAWSALINKATGALTVSIADREGAYVVFGQCRVAPIPPELIERRRNSYSVAE